MNFLGILSREDREEFLENMDINYTKLDTEVANFLHNNKDTKDYDRKMIWIIRTLTEKLKDNNDELLSHAVDAFKSFNKVTQCKQPTKTKKSVTTARPLNLLIQTCLH